VIPGDGTVEIRFWMIRVKNYEPH